MDSITENIKKLFIGENEKMDVDKPDEKIKKNFNEFINFCSRCGGNHFDLSCIYSKN